ncbi:glutaredoxin family protein [Chlorobium limicola]|uniref:Glutaredoxin n=1 Tax=Chlorobium limicola TaxID=1092 RepID=A0A101JL05_CHLLI|nr:glutaredoxin family protein [Chlorobium limicola]KUL28697.1 glutaredoxin [Chlorobium limicola]
MNRLHTVTLYGKKDCCLCDQAMTVLYRVQASVPFVLEKVDIASQPDLFEKFGEQIPVILVDGVAAFRYRVREDRLAALLAEPAQ